MTFFGVPALELDIPNIPDRAPQFEFAKNYNKRTPEQQRADELRKKVKDLNLPVPKRVQDKIDEVARREEFGEKETEELSKMRFRYMRGFNEMPAEERMEGWYDCQAKMVGIIKNANEREAVRKSIDDTYVKCEKEIDAAARVKAFKPIKEEPVDDYEDEMEDQPSTSAGYVRPVTPPPVVKAKRGRKRKEQIVEVEKTYCICQEDRKGKMVFCEGKDCKIEWFHFKCVGMRRAPPGDWFCKDCQPEQDSSDDDATYRP